MRTVTVEIDDTVYRLLETLGPVEAVVGQLIDHAQQGVYRPGSWERPWLEQAFGYEWQAKLEPGDPYGRPDSPMFQRPKS